MVLLIGQLQLEPQCVNKDVRNDRDILIKETDIISFKKLHLNQQKTFLFFQTLCDTKGDSDLF